MNYVYWTVTDGKLGTAADNLGSEYDFKAASLVNSKSPIPPNLVDLVNSEIDDGPLGSLLLTLLGGTPWSELAIQAFPAPLTLFPKGVNARPMFGPTVEHRLEKRMAREAINAERLTAFQSKVNSPAILRQLLPETLRSEFSFKALEVDSFPIELELVVATNRSYRLQREVFCTESEHIVIGVHDRTVAELESQLRPTRDDMCKLWLDAVDQSRLLRRARWHLRAELAKLFAILLQGLAEKSQVREVLTWLAVDGHDDEIPPFLRAQLKAVEDTVSAIGIRGRFGSLRADIMETIRERMVAHLL